MQFPHRHNSDGFVDSICPRCYITVVSATNEADLARSEAAHVCDRARRKQYERGVSSVYPIANFRKFLAAGR